MANRKDEWLIRLTNTEVAEVEAAAHAWILRSKNYVADEQIGGEEAETTAQSQLLSASQLMDAKCRTAKTNQVNSE